LRDNAVGPSIERRLIIRIVVIFLIAFGVVFSGLVSRTFTAIKELDEISLQTQAGSIADHLTVVDEHSVQIALPDETRRLYSPPDGPYYFAVLDGAGKFLLSSSALAQDELQRNLPQTLKAGLFPMSDLAGEIRSFLGYLMPFGDMWIVVARHTEDFSENVATSVIEEYLEVVGWWILLIMVAAIVVCVWTVRTTFRPIDRHAELLRSMEIGSPVPLPPSAGFPSEIAPFVEAVNVAFDHLQQAYAAQQRFISDAAHQIRTPLAVLTARLESMSELPDKPALLRDSTRINRIVDQLLKLSRLETVHPDTSSDVDLHEVARDVVGDMAPYVVKEDRRIELTGPHGHVAVKGNYDAIFQALQNLIENAVQASPVDGLVSVSVSDNAVIRVLDRGVGIKDTDKEKVFDRFWRGSANRSTGSGLGLAIVKKIMEAHGGSVTVVNRTAGGTAFMLKFPRPSA